MLLSQGQIGFIDFDSFCQAEPAMDLALFLSSLKKNGMRGLYDERNRMDGTALDPATCQAGLAQLDELGEVVLAHYERHAPVSRQRVALWEACYLFRLVLRSWARVQPDRLVHVLTLLERHGRATGLW